MDAATAVLEILLEQKCTYQEFVRKQLKLAEENIMKQMSNSELKRRMRLTLRLTKEDRFGKNFRAFVQELWKEAQALHLNDVTTKYQGTGKDPDTESEDYCVPCFAWIAQRQRITIPIMADRPPKVESSLTTLVESALAPLTPSSRGIYQIA